MGGACDHDGEDRQRRRPPRRRRDRRRSRGDGTAFHQADAAHQGPLGRLYPGAQDRPSPGRRCADGPGGTRRSMNIKLVLEYEGTGYHGWQAQSGGGLHEQLDLAAMQAAGERLEGRHDFRAFGHSPRPGGHTVRQVHDVTVSALGEWVTIAVAADAFLYGMVRRIAGALVDIGRRKRTIDWIDALLGGSSDGLRLAPPH